MSQEKDPKKGREGDRGKAAKTLLGVPPRPASAPPGIAPLNRSRFPGLRPPQEVPKSVPSPRAKLPSVEEISNSLLVSDESTGGQLPGLEELSGSLLLDDPTVVVPDPTLSPPLPAAQARAAPVARPFPMGLPDLPPATPGPNLDSFLSTATAMAPHPATGADPFAVAGPEAPAAAHHVEAPLGEPVGSQAPDPPGASRGPPAVVSHATAPVSGDVEVTALPPGRLVAAMETLKKGLGYVRSAFATGSRSPAARRTWLLPAVALTGLVVGVGLVSVVVSLTRKATAPTEASTEAPVAEEKRPATPVLAVPAPVIPSEGASSAPCAVAGTPRVVAPSAVVPSGIEVRALGDDVALGFAPDEHRATVLRLDPVSLSSSATVEAKSIDPIRRVVPLGSSKVPLGIAVDVDHKGDAVQGRRTIPLETPLQIGAAGGNLVWAHRGGSVGGTLWPIDGEGDVEAARGAAELGDSAAATAVAVRHANAIWLGAATGHDSLSPSGGLSRLGGFGSTVGSPAVAINGGVVVAAWADRASSSDPWRLRWVRFKAGEAAGDPSTFIPPAGGRGVQSMSPSIAAIPGGRFLLVWTEGPATGHDVRALTLSRTGEPIGPPLDVSNKSANAGQGQAAVNASRQGLVAFLEATDSGFQVVATPIGCGL